MKRRYIAALGVLVVACGPSQSDSYSDAPTSETLTLDALASMEGSWTGTLTYLDYGDNETQVDLPAHAEFVRVSDTLVFTFFYTEPNGSLVDDQGFLLIEAEGNISVNGEGWQVVEAEQDSSGLLNQLVISQRGQDAGRPALLTRSFVVGTDGLRITQDVLLDGDSVSFQRNQHRFSRPQ